MRSGVDVIYQGTLAVAGFRSARSTWGRERTSRLSPRALSSTRTTGR
jgi:hypothetical protein